MAGFKASELTPILSAQPGVCQLCRGWSSTYPRCFQCNEFLADIDRRDRPVVAPMGLAIKHEPLAAALWAYKDHANASVRSVAEEKLRNLLGVMGRRHEDCIAAAAGVDSFELVTWVPSGKRSAGQHPLRRLVSQARPFSERFRDVLRTADPASPGRVLSESRFIASSDAVGRACLIVDDTWTTGASALSAALALRNGGATAVGVLVLGRHFVPEFRDAHVYSDHAKAQGFTADHCTFCDPRPVADPALPSRG